MTEKVHDVLAARVAPARLRLFVPAGAVIVPPSHDPVRPLGVEIISPDGRLSKKMMPVIAKVFGFVIVKLKAVVSPGPGNSSCESANDLVIIGGNATVKVAVAGWVVSAFVDVSVLVVLLSTPATVPTTFNEMVQVVPLGALTVPPDKLMEPEPAVAVTVPPQLLVRPFGVATTTLAGNVSVNARPVIATAALFVIVNVRVLPPPTGITFGENALVKVGPG